MNRSSQIGASLAPTGMAEICAIVALLCIGLVFTTTRAAAQMGSGPAIETEAPSFDIWCLEIQSFLAARCNERRGDDMEAYEHYRALVEQLAQQREDRVRRDQNLMELLNREPGDTDPLGPEQLENRE